MLRSTIFLSIVALAALVYGVYYVGQQAQMLRSDLLETNRQLKENLDELHVLHAEWAYLTKPKRLEELTRRYLNSSLITTAQIREVASIDFQADTGATGDVVKVSTLIKTVQ